MDSQGIHFHIQWSSDDRLDWERFDTSAKAIERAASMVDDGETSPSSSATTSANDALRVRRDLQPPEPPRQVFVIQMNEARAEWKRRHCQK